MQEHYKDMADYFLENILGRSSEVCPDIKDTKINFYKNHI